jgi:hypothetical protein
MKLSPQASDRRRWATVGCVGDIQYLQVNFLAGFTQELQRNTDRVIDLKELVVKTFASDAAGKSALSELFQVSQTPSSTGGAMKSAKLEMCEGNA